LLRLKERPRLFADETTAPVLDPGRGCTKTGQLLAYASSGWLGRETPARRRALDRDPQSDQRLSAGGPGPHDPLAERRTHAEFYGGRGDSLSRPVAGRGSDPGLNQKPRTGQWFELKISAAQNLKTPLRFPIKPALRRLMVESLDRMPATWAGRWVAGAAPRFATG
jgi:hypothetical protein